MPENKAIVAVCSSQAQAKKAIAALQRVGFDMKHVSVCGKAYAGDEEIVGCYLAAGRLRARGGSGPFWERLWNLLSEGGLFHVPGIGPVALAGFLVNTLATTPANAVVIGGLTAEDGAIRSIGVPTDSDYVYQAELRAGKRILIAFGAPEVVARAKAEIENARAAESVRDHG